MMQQAGNVDVNSLVQKLRRLATLDTTVFEEVRTDAAATAPAIIVAAVAMFASGIGGWLWWMFTDFGDNGKMFVQSVIIGSILGVAIWFVWVGITYVMLTQVFRARSDPQELVRVMGFAAAPLALSILIFIPGLDYGIGIASLALFFGTTVLAVDTATDAPAGRALVATAAGFAVWAVILGLLVTDSHAWAPGFFVLDRPVDALRSLASGSYF
jgi:hypothetical protein